MRFLKQEDKIDDSWDDDNFETPEREKEKESPPQSPLIGKESSPHSPRLGGLMDKGQASLIPCLLNEARPDEVCHYFFLFYLE